jgi:hypothetical protein
MRALALLLALAACGGDDDAAAPDAGPPAADWDRDVVSTDLSIDLATRAATASITIAGDPDRIDASFEIGDLAITSVDVPHTIDGGELHVRTERGADTTVTVAYTFQYHDGFEGADDAPPLTLTWPYHCGNLFPCKAHRTPADGVRFTLDLSGVPDDVTAIYPAALAEAPVYQLAWAIDPYVELALGTTNAGTAVSIWHAAGQEAAAAQGGAHLVAAFDWLEQNLGAYRFGDHVGGVGVRWGFGQYGGMEHHPYWHVASGAIGDEEVQIHEAAHGWFGDGVRLRCWEDFVMSEGTVTYLAAHVRGIVDGAAAEDATWADYEQRLGRLAPGPAWPTTCGEIDIAEFFTDTPYIKGAYFYRAVADAIGADVLDAALADFYAAHAGQAAGMQDLLDAIEARSGWDPTPCADQWLRADGVPADRACP